MKTLLKFIGYIIGFLLLAAGLVALVLYMMGLANGNTEGNILTTMTPVATATMDPNGNTTIEDTQQNGTSSVSIGTPTPVPTPTPAEPTPTPTPVPTPTPEPVPAGESLGEGKVSTDTGEWIDLEVLWTAKTIDANKAELSVTANLRSYRLNTGAKKDGLRMTADGETVALDVDALNVDGQDVITELGTYIFEVDAPVGKISLIPLEVVFDLGIPYSGKQLDNLTVTEDIQISR